MIPIEAPEYSPEASPFASRSAPLPRDETPAPATPLPSVPPPPPAPAPQRAAPKSRRTGLGLDTLILSTGLAVTCGLVVGYAIGWNKALATKAGPIANTAPLQADTPSTPSPAEESPESMPEPELAKPPEAKIAETAAVPEKPPKEEEEPMKVLTAPEAALRAFLAAPDWQSRTKHSVEFKKRDAAMADYYSSAPDGAITPLSVKLLESRDGDDGTAETHVYQVTTSKMPEGIPVAVMKAEDGWRVDWGTFVELHDDHFSRFAGGQGNTEGFFHLLIRITNFAPKREGYTAFRLDPPMAGRDRYGFVRSDSELHKALASLTDWGKPGQVILRLQRNPAEDGKNWLEITDLVSAEWWPASE